MRLIRYILTIFMFVCHFANSYAQLFDDFTDSNLNSDPVWEGDVTNFIVNDNSELQLNATEGEESYLFTQLNMPDSIVWEFESRLEFAPSDNNRLRVYLAINTIDLATASGYYIEMGENGSNDALNLYYLNNGTVELLASGNSAAVANDPAYARLQVIYFPDGMWTISAAYGENEPFTDEIILQHNEYDFSGNQIFQIACFYTSSRTDKFFFDNIEIKKFEFDKTGPEFLNAEIIDAQTIDIQANEALDMASAEDLSNFIIEAYTGTIVGASLINNDTGIRITLSEALQNGVNYSLQVSNVQDAFLNSSETQSFPLFIPDIALPGDLVVNEILFNPETGGVDYLEILNISDKFIDLQNLIIANTSRGEEKEIEISYFIEPNQHLCLTEDVSYVITRYETPDSANFLSTDIPAFNNDSGNVSILRPGGEVIDAFNYSEDLHFQELDDVNGVSLERINPFGETQNSSNWFSASSSVLFGTPGYKNSIFLNPTFAEDELLDFENKTFSPNDDGMDDQLIIKYNLPDFGYLVDINIYDQGGRKVKTLINNLLLSSQGFVLWDGINDEGELSNIGIYLVAFEAFNEQGKVISTIKTAILADFLD